MIASFFFSLNLSDKIIKMEKKKIDDDKKKMVEQKKIKRKTFFVQPTFFLSQNKQIIQLFFF